MNNNFLSIVSVINAQHEIRILTPFLINLHTLLKDNFSDYEIILVNNSPGVKVDAALSPLDAELKHNIYLLNLSSKINRNHAFVAGLDRSNGDYTIIFELAFYQSPHLILDLFEKTKTPFDIVYLRAKEKSVKPRFRLFYLIFYQIFKHYSNLEIDQNAHNTRIISRRALNSLLRMRENLRYMKAIYSIVGYRTSYLETEEQVIEDQYLNFSDRFQTSLMAISSFTTFLRSMLLWIFIFSFVFLISVSVNALKFKFTGVDLFGNVNEAAPGWTFLVILIAIFFAVTCLNLYIMSIYLSNIYNEIKQRPLYMVESFKRF